VRIEVSSTSLRMELSMSDTKTVSPLRQRMIEDMAARKLNPHTQAQPHFELQAVRRLAEAFARYSDARRGAAFPTAPHLMKAAAETTLAIAADPKRLGARIGVTAVLHTWGSALTHHPCI